MPRPIVKAENGDIHVMPVNDLREHREARGCWCDPRVEEVTDGIVWLPRKVLGVLVVHNSLDGRELVEASGVH